MVSCRTLWNACFEPALKMVDQQKEDASLCMSNDHNTLHAVRKIPAHDRSQKGRRDRCLCRSLSGFLGSLKSKTPSRVHHGAPIPLKWCPRWSPMVSPKRSFRGRRFFRTHRGGGGSPWRKGLLLVERSQDRTSAQHIWRPHQNGAPCAHK